MKHLITKTLSIFIFMSLIFLVNACSSEETKSENSLETNQVLKQQKQNTFEAWQSANLSTLFSKFKDQSFSYTFSKEGFKQNLANDQLKHFRFYLGVKNNQLEITVYGLTADEMKLPNPQKGKITLNSTKFENYKNISTLNFAAKLKKVTNKSAKKHILALSSAVDYIVAWENALKDLSTLESKVSYDAIRIRSFTIHKEAIEFLVNKNQSSNIELFLGLNKEFKMTTVFLESGNLDNKLSKQTNRTYALDLTTPCPNMCDKKMDDLYN
ncbi:hypothetical protein A8C32_06655 [Flavivirga aquatica]|uniref:Lipoprotein n=1 Tax=Flavivirga aquatica TaxID=1849968 RepID=A0A1E5SIC2_9FLAO|nr:hypothetical protein [Flavivirga aquatica]OEJ98863.1 hypothetical protein A8C32_06655 [Flavivirga aquatica]